MLVCWIAIQRLSVLCCFRFPIGALERPPRPSSTPDPACRLPIDSELGADYFLSILEIIIDRSSHQGRTPDRRAFYTRMHIHSLYGFISTPKTPDLDADF